MKKTIEKQHIIVAIDDVLHKIERINRQLQSHTQSVEEGENASIWSWKKAKQQLIDELYILLSEFDKDIKTPAKAA